jgi:Protein of unknown function (DUF3486)
MSPVPNHENGRNSSVVTNLPPDLRKQLDRAILDQQPNSLADCHEAFDLHSFRISLPALYRYGRRLRERQDLCEAAARVHPDDPDVTAFLPTLLGRRLLSILLDDENATPETLHRLTLAYRAAHTVNRDIQRDKAKIPPTDPETEAIRAKAIADLKEYSETLHQRRLEADRNLIAHGYDPKTPAHQTASATAAPDCAPEIPPRPPPPHVDGPCTPHECSTSPTPIAHRAHDHPPQPPAPRSKLVR